MEQYVDIRDIALIETFEILFSLSRIAYSYREDYLYGKKNLRKLKFLMPNNKKKTF